MSSGSTYSGILSRRGRRVRSRATSPPRLARCPTRCPPISRFWPRLASSQRAEGRHIRYRADMETMQALLSFLMEDCCGGGRLALCAFAADQFGAARVSLRHMWERLMKRDIQRTFLCTGNSARSILRGLSEREGKVASRLFAGSYPRGTVNPLSIALLDREASRPHLRSKSWANCRPGAGMDFVFTVCDDAAPKLSRLPGHPMTALGAWTLRRSG